MPGLNGPLLARIGGHIRRSFDNGNLFFAIGALGVAGGAMTFMAEQNEQQNADELQSLRGDMNRLMAAQDHERQLRKDTLPTDPAKFQATVTRRVIGQWAFDGPIALTAVKVGDVVDVLETDTGPDKSYYRCRAESQAGLYPKHFLERII